MTDCVKCGARGVKVSSAGACLQCCAQDLVEERLIATGRGDEVIDVDAIIGANLPTCPSCDSNTKTVRLHVGYTQRCTDVWHDLAAPNAEERNDDR